MVMSSLRAATPRQLPAGQNEKCGGRILPVCATVRDLFLSPRCRTCPDLDHDPIYTHLRKLKTEARNLQDPERSR